MAGSTFASRSYRDEAVVLRTYKLAEADRIVILLTKDHGQVRAVAKGVRRTTSRFGARLEPFNVATLQLVQGRTLDIVSQALGKRSYGEQIGSDYAKYTAAAAMVETAEKLTADDYDTARQHYHLLIGALSAVARGLHEPGRTLDSYLLRAVSIAGWAPSLVDCARCGAPGPHRFPPRSAARCVLSVGHRGPPHRARRPSCCCRACWPETGKPSMPRTPRRRGPPRVWSPATFNGTWNDRCVP